MTRINNVQESCEEAACSSSPESDWPASSLSRSKIPGIFSFSAEVAEQMMASRGMVNRTVSAAMSVLATVPESQWLRVGLQYSTPIRLTDATASIAVSQILDGYQV